MVGNMPPQQIFPRKRFGTDFANKAPAECVRLYVSNQMFWSRVGSTAVATSVEVGVVGAGGILASASATALGRRCLVLIR